jgi:hypothetical protein
MDDTAYEILSKLNLPGVNPITLKDFERDDELLLSAKQNRSRIEYYFTCTPSLLLYVLNNWPEVDLITYLDADLFFFSSPTPLFEELGGGSISIIGHRFPPYLRYRERYGIYNVGWLSFRRDENALSCLKWWRERCVEWCYDREEDGRFADQKYLDDWPERFKNVTVLEHKGANLALWNLPNYHLQLLERNKITVDDQPLIFFHFHGLIRIHRWVYNPLWKESQIKPTIVLRRRIYAPYLQTLFDLNRRLLAKLVIDSTFEDVRSKMKQQGKQLSQVQRVVKRIRSLSSVGRDILAGKYIFCLNGYVI